MTAPESLCDLEMIKADYRLVSHKDRKPDARTTPPKPKPTIRWEALGGWPPRLDSEQFSSAQGPGVPSVIR